MVLWSHGFQLGSLTVAGLLKGKNLSPNPLLLLLKLLSPPLPNLLGPNLYSNSMVLVSQAIRSAASR